MKKILLILILVLPAQAGAQFAANYITTSLPLTCVVGQLTYRTASGIGLYICSATDTWTLLAAPQSANGRYVPSGMVVISINQNFGIQGCPTGWTQVTDLSSRTLLGTIGANFDAGTQGGSDTITPAGTNSAPTFTGSSATTSAVSAGTPAGTNGTVSITPLGSVAAPTFTGNSVTSSAVTGGTPAGTISALTTGADSSTTGGVAKAIAQTPIFTGSALATHTHTTTATGTNSAPTFTGSSTTVGAETFTGSALGTHTHTLTATGTNSTPTFTGTQFDNRSAYEKVIFCQAN